MKTVTEKKLGRYLTFEAVYLRVGQRNAIQMQISLAPRLRLAFSSQVCGCTCIKVKWVSPRETLS